MFEAFECHRCLHCGKVFAHMRKAHPKPMYCSERCDVKGESVLTPNTTGGGPGYPKGTCGIDGDPDAWAKAGLRIE